LYTGTVTAVAAGTGQGTAITATGTTLFTDSANNGLFNLASNLPSGTPIWYETDGTNNPANGGKWLFSASLSNGGAFCVDYTGAAKSYATGTASSTSVITVANYLCN